MRVPAEDRRQVEVVVDGHVYRQRDGFFEMPDRHASAQLQAGGFGRSWQVAPPVSPSSGYRCGKCGHGSHFVTCGRCGATCEKES